MKEISESFNIHPYRKRNRENAFCAFTFGILLFMILFLILLTSLCNFALTYQTQNMLREVKVTDNQAKPINQESTEFPQTGNTPEITSEKTTKLSSQTATNIPTSSIIPTTTSSHTTDTDAVTETSKSPSTSTPTTDASSEKISTDSALTSTEPVEKRNPIVILNEVIQFKKNFTFIKSCDNPSIITAHLELKLSARGENTLILNIPVMTTEEGVAKRKAAYIALGYLYKDHLSEAQTDPEWELSPISFCSNQVENNTQNIFE